MQIGEYSLLSAGANTSDRVECAVLDTNVVIDMELFYFNQTSEKNRQSLKDLLLYLVKDRVELSIGFALLESCHQWRSGFDENNFQRKRYVAEVLFQWDENVIERQFANRHPPVSRDKKWRDRPYQTRIDPLAYGFDGTISDCAQFAIHYASLLKIMLLAQKMKADNRLNLLAEYVSWVNTRLGTLSAYELQVAVDMLVGSTSRSEQARKLIKYSSNESIDDLSRKAWNAAWDCYFISVTDAYEAGLEYETGMPKRKTVLVTRNIDPVWLREKATLSDVENEEYSLPVPKIECTLDLRKGITESKVLSILNTVHERQKARQLMAPSNQQIMKYIQMFEGEAGLNQSAFVDTPLR
ncbi:hypothetical protein BLI708_10275 [Bifidobacterium imperatoris]|uniref:PIN domain-containing protein n=1 Tax=Bifidobacterium imperatoris TaxID=2020965 RepID=A0A2N5IRE5_9BIFI|nr:hypothetical protein [Bifidobacterium imperatoris]PLS24537.1 hypothetical protein Tam1G_1445 [Bifidobacterium imperatoris]QSY57579.1 hypothetical protein BLI708_10275 [Bifidobacterium imperatoris]